MAMGLLARVRASLPDAHWDAVGPAITAPPESVSATASRIARRLAIELDGARSIVVVLNDESRTTNPDLVATVVRAATAARKTVKVLFARGSHPLGSPDASRKHVDRAFARLGPEDLDGVRVGHHVAKDPEVLGPLGSVLL